MSDNAELTALIAADIAENPWPNGYSASDSGMWYTPAQVVPTDGSAPTLRPPLWICDRFDVIAKTADDVKENCGLLLRWCDREGHTHERIVSERMLHADGNILAQDLAAAGLKIGEEKHHHAHLKTLLNRIKPKRQRLCVNQSGWHEATEGGFTFIMPSGEAFGPDSEDIVLLNPGKEIVESMRPHGTLEEWQENVAKYAIGNYWHGLFLCASFASPLLGIMKEGTSGAHLVGEAQTGKTTAVRIASSVWGDSAKGFIHQWNATDNGLEVLAARRSGSLLPLDELSQANPHVVGKAVYMLANQSGKVRMDYKTFGEKSLLTWELIFLSTGEKTLSDRLGEVGGVANAGQEVRMVNIPSDMGCGLGAYRELHGMKNGALLSDHLEHATKTYYGTAGRAFIKEIAEARAISPDGLIASIKADRDKFLKTNAKLLEGANGQVKSVAKRFGLFAAAGELACYMGILPWPLGEAHLAAASGLKAWIDSRGGIGAAEDTQALAMVRGFIATHSESRFLEIFSATELSKTTEITERWKTINKAGYKRRTASDGWEFQWELRVEKVSLPVAIAGRDRLGRVGTGEILSPLNRPPTHRLNTNPFSRLKLNSTPVDNFRSLNYRRRFYFRSRTCNFAVLAFCISAVLKLRHHGRHDFPASGQDRAAEHDRTCAPPRTSPAHGSSLEDAEQRADPPRRRTGERRPATGPAD